MNFCPYCANILLIRKKTDTFSFSCPTCVYSYPIIKKVKKVQEISPIKLDEIISGSSAQTMKSILNLKTNAYHPSHLFSLWDLVPCEKGCGNEYAFYEQLQTRSADEPTTIFYKCTNPECGYCWREN